MEATMAPKRRKEVDIPEDVEDIDDYETYKYLCETRPEGNILLNEKETREFMDWLDVKER